MFRRLCMVFTAIGLGGCVVMPTGPSVMSLPGSGKSFDQFRVDDFECRQYASAAAGVPAQAIEQSAVTSAAVGTAVGAIAGAAIGGRDGAAVGAGTGLIVGSVSGAGAGSASAYEVQCRYDHAYLQCMYAKGHKIPASQSYVGQPSRGVSPTPPAEPRGYYPPPPPPPRPPRQ